VQAISVLDKTDIELKKDEVRGEEGGEEGERRRGKRR
jgi:hypothetical protein